MRLHTFFAIHLLASAGTWCGHLRRCEDVADTVDTIEEHYAQFVPAARDASAKPMDRGVGIEERAKSEAAWQEVVGIR